MEGKFLRIVHLSTHDITGGAARAAYRLHTGLRHIGQTSSMFVLRRNSSDPNVTAFVPPMDLISRLRRRLRQVWLMLSFARYRMSRPAGHEVFSDDRTRSTLAIL